MTIAVDHDAFRIALGDVQRGAHVLRDERDAISREVTSLLQGWTGIAGEAFAEGWAQWRSGTEDVLDGLLTMGRLLDAVHDDLSHCDVGSQTSLDRIAARLG